MTSTQIDTIARACHEANRAWCLALGDCSQATYDDAPENIRASARNGVIPALTATPTEQHDSWCAFKIADGWTFGQTKCADAKTHPCLVPYVDLPQSQKVKDGIYIATVRVFAAAFDSLEVASANP